MMVFDGSRNIEVEPQQCTLKVMNEDPFYYYVNPAKDRNVVLLEDLQNCLYHVRDLPDKIRSQHSVGEIKPEDLVNFPKFTKNSQRIVIEFQDCVI
jgi:hypothetical protein